jgi:hypothetical protein
MARVTDPPDLVRTLARIRRELRRIPLDHPRRATDFRLMRKYAEIYGALDSRTPTTTPEDTLREAGIDDAWRARYQRKFSTLLAGRAKASS